MKLIPILQFYSILIFSPQGLSPDTYTSSSSSNSDHSPEVYTLHSRSDSTGSTPSFVTKLGYGRKATLHPSSVYTYHTNPSEVLESSFSDNNYFVTNIKDANSSPRGVRITTNGEIYGVYGIDGRGSSVRGPGRTAAVDPFDLGSEDWISEQVH